MTRLIVNLLFVAVLVMLFLYAIESLTVWIIFIVVWFAADYLAAGKTKQQ